MDETSDQIERHIEQTRNDLHDNFNELGEKVKKAVDWRVQFEERPGTALFSSGRRSRGDYGAVRELAKKQVWTPFVPSSTPPASKPSQTRQNVEALASALIAVAVNRASRFIDSLVPGFEREFSSARASKSAASSRSDSGSLAESHAQLRSSAAEAD
jgi:hypothetical protein